MPDIQKFEGEIIPYDQRENLPAVTDKPHSIMTTGQISVLRQKTPLDVIFQREVGGRACDYVKVGWVIQKLNEAVGFDWDWVRDQVDIDKENDQVVYYGHLVVRIRDVKTMQILGEIVKYAEGGSDIKRYKNGKLLDLGNDVKAARSDAIKKAAQSLGIALDLAWDDDEDKRKLSPREQATEAQRTAPPPPSIDAGKVVPMPEKQDIPCNVCGTVLTAVTGSKGTLTAEQVAQVGVQKFGVPLCPSCYKKALTTTVDLEKETKGLTQAQVMQLATNLITKRVKATDIKERGLVPDDYEKKAA